jgi:hypothetical protein
MNAVGGRRHMSNRVAVTATEEKPLTSPMSRELGAGDVVCSYASWLDTTAAILKVRFVRSDLLSSGAQRGWEGGNFRAVCADPP